MRARAAGSEIVARGREGSVLGSSTRAPVEVDTSAVFASGDTLATLSRTTFGCPLSHSPTRGRCAAPARRIPENAHRGVVLAAGDDLDVVEGGGHMVRALQGFEVGVCCDIGVPELVLDQLLPNDSFRGQTQRFVRTDHRRCVPPGGRHHRAPARSSTRSSATARRPARAEPPRPKPADGRRGPVRPRLGFARGVCDPCARRGSRRLLLSARLLQRAPWTAFRGPKHLNFT